jgi:hypothetical protein
VLAIALPDRVEFVTSPFAAWRRRDSINHVDAPRALRRTGSPALGEIT